MSFFSNILSRFSKNDEPQLAVEEVQTFEEVGPVRVLPAAEPAASATPKSSDAHSANNPAPARVPQPRGEVKSSKSLTSTRAGIPSSKVVQMKPKESNGHAKQVDATQLPKPLQETPIIMSPNNPPMRSQVSHQAISDRAYAIWEEQGKPHGRAEEIWLTAEQQLRRANS